MESALLPRAFAPVVLLVALSVSRDAVAQEQSPEVERPKFNFVRWTEDWSALQGLPEGQANFWDGIKYVPLNDDGTNWVSFGGSVESRGENWHNFAFGAPPVNDDAFLLWRLRLHADARFGENLRVYVEGKHADASDRDLPGGRRALDVDTLALEEAFLDYTIPMAGESKLTIRPGRQKLVFGKQRLVSALPWANTLRRWDGVRVNYESGGWTTSAFWTYFAPTQKYDFNDSDSDNEFWGVHSTGAPGGGALKMDLYYFGSDRTSVTFNGTTGGNERHTFGARVFGAEGQFDYDVEAAYQTGRVGQGDVQAFMVGSQFGYRTDPDSAQNPRLWVGFDFGSGDKNAGGDVETFDQLFPLGHAHLGLIDVVGRQNIIDASVGASMNVASRTVLGAAVHNFWRHRGSDAFYNSGGGVARAATSSASRVGSELDVTLRYRHDVHTSFLLGYSHFFAADFIDETGANDDIDFAYAEVKYFF